MRQRALEIRLQGLEGFANPRADLEQYPTPAPIAADILYTAHGLGDIAGRSVLDLGCGTGIFAIGAALLGAARVVGADSDGKALETARRNAAGAGCDLEFTECDVSLVSGRFDTCVMNPPFGAQKKHADLPFLDKAMELAGVVYSLHNAETAPFLRDRVARAGWSVDLERGYGLEIRHTFKFHTREKMMQNVVLMRSVRP